VERSAAHIAFFCRAQSSGQKAPPCAPGPHCPVHVVPTWSARCHENNELDWQHVVSRVQLFQKYCPEPAIWSPHSWITAALPRARREIQTDRLLWLLRIRRSTQTSCLKAPPVP